MANRNLCFVSMLLPLIWGGTFLMVKIGIQGFSPINLAILRFLIAGVAFLPLFVSRRVVYRPIQKCDMLHAVVLLGALLSGQLLLNFVMESAPTSLAGLVVQTAPLLTAIASVLLGFEPFTPKVAVGSGVAFFGVAIVLGGDLVTKANAQFSSFTVVLLFMVPVAIAVYTVAGKVMFMKYGPANFSGQLLIAAALLSSLATPFRPSLLSEIHSAPIQAWIGVLGLALLANVVALILWSVALKHMSRSQVASLMHLVPMVAVVLGWALLGEHVTLVTLAGGVSIMAGLVLINRAPAELHEKRVLS